MGSSEHTAPRLQQEGRTCSSGRRFQPSSVCLSWGLAAAAQLLLSVAAQVMQPKAVPGPSECSVLECSAARPGSDAGPSDTPLQPWTRRVFPLALWLPERPHLAPCRHKDSPATSLFRLFQTALGARKRPSKISKLHTLAECPWSVLPFLFPSLPLPLPLASSRLGRGQRGPYSPHSLQAFRVGHGQEA